ncbi:MAG: hypothetical protein M3P45_13605, partial [Acidobacteriota bacterium]|nr:hypothetical protein [Acidobacteriota bacterium]
MPSENVTGNHTHPDQTLGHAESGAQVSASQTAAGLPLRDRFKAESPKIPGVGELRTRTTGITPKHLAMIAVVVLLAAGLTMHWMASLKRASNTKAAAPAELQRPAQMPSPAAPPATEANSDQLITTVAEMGKAWSSKEFVYRNVFSGQTTQAMLVRLPKGTATQSSGYWAFAMNAAYGNCKLEYLTDMNRLRTDYGYRQGTHPMVGDPCSRSV